MKISWLAIAISAALASAAPVPAIAHGAQEKVTPALQQAIPNIPGKSLIAVVVDYPPGGASPAHEHAKSAFIYGYVVSGVAAPRQRRHAWIRIVQARPAQPKVKA